MFSFVADFCWLFEKEIQKKCKKIKTPKNEKLIWDEISFFYAIFT